MTRGYQGFSVLTDEGDDFFAEPFAFGASGFLSQQTEADREVPDLQPGRTGECNAPDSIAEEIEEGKFIALPGLARQFCKRETDRWIRKAKMLGHILESERLQHLEDGCLEIVHRDGIFVVVTLQVDGDTLGDVLGKPPAMVTDMFGRLLERGRDPALVKGGIPSIGKYDQGCSIAKCNHGIL